MEIISNEELEFAIGWGKDHSFVKDLLKKKLIPTDRLLELINPDDLDPSLVKSLQNNQIPSKYCLLGGGENGDIRFYDYDEVNRIFVECTDSVYIFQGTSFATPRYITDKLTKRFIEFYKFIKTK